ncbi:type VI secretion system Vgr family protein [Pseudoduganella chitinolytica]|uniref:Type VI secretion system Vgr family protein n=1 Tax=Pseudoduganella chitinolytica TaxID=34070 RepID=A0ABY8B7N6_9BURK|nr:type VI secretion system Vgr family protein [Pseudoduganella chitinolytica]WEF31947.1 type VI secretion system Vgr family protein [Pseudoduganella chitinolytica]
MTDLLALLEAHQSTRLLRLSFPKNDGPEVKLMVNRFEGTEYLSRDFEFRVELLSDDARLELEAMHGKLLCVSLVQADGSLRPFTGYVTSFQLVKTDGGVAFYEAVLRPWLAYLRLRRNNRLFHVQSLREQTEAIFAGYGGLPSWEWEVAGEQPQFTMATQWDETDHNYLCRRWEAAGYSHWYEHSNEGHTLKVCDDTRTTAPIDGPSPGIRFQRAGGVAEEDAIGDWSPLRQWASAQTAVSGFDFKNPRPVHADSVSIDQQGDIPPLEVHSYEGHYGFKHQSGAYELSRLRMEEIEARGKLYAAQGNNRRVAPGRWFTLLDHFGESEDSEFLILEVHHTASNNYLQGRGAISEYKNRLLCQSKAAPWRPGRGFNSTETKLLALQTAIVVGAEGQGSLNVDEYGRVQVKFHWDRDESGSCWVRVSSNWAGGEKGLASHPRVGSEVIVQWLDGNPDHPIITGAVYNQSYMPPWKLPEQRALTGLRSRELTADGGNTPGGRSNHMVLDDTQGQIQAQLKSDHLASQLSLGHISRIEDNAGRKDARGQGFELRTDGHGAVRAQQGLLLSTEGRPNARAHITDMEETLARMAQGKELHDSLSQAAQQAQAHQAGDQDQVIAALQAQIDALKGQGGAPAQGEFPEFQAPHLTLASPAGIETTTEGSTHLMSVEHSAVTSGGHISLSAGKSLLVSVKEAVRMFAYKAGMKLVAASADIDITALKDSINILAKLNITHTANKITITAKEEVVINGGSSFSRWNASGIVHGTSGNWVQHAAHHSFVPAKSKGTRSLPQPMQLAPGQLDLHHQYVNPEGSKKQGIRQGDYTVVDAEGGEHQGTLDGDGFASVAGLPMGMAAVTYGKDPRDPWDEGSVLGQETEWPAAALPEGGAAAGAAGATAGQPAPGGGMLSGASAAAASLKGAAGQARAMVQAAQQAAGAVQSLKQGGAQALLAPLGQAAMANVAGKLPGGAAALSAYGALSGGNPAAAVASTLGLPGSLPRIGADVPAPSLKKSLV